MSLNTEEKRICFSFQRVRSEKEHARMIHKKVVGLDFDRLQFQLVFKLHYFVIHF